MHNSDVDIFYHQYVNGDSSGNSIARVKSNSKFVDITVESLDLVNESIQNLTAVFKKYDTVICCSGFSTGNVPSA